jgi:4-amino-4-deoxy-L-arabinose transferase-like glycosyltransferase
VGLSGRIFGFNSWSILAPQALMGVAAVALLWATVRRISGPGAGLLAGTVLLAVALWPASSRPYIGGSTDNSPLELAFGYNGLGRIFGQGRSGGGPGAGDLPQGMVRGMGGMFGGDPGLTRLFTGSFGTQIAWLSPAALLLLVVGYWLTRRAPRTDLARAGLLLWGGWVTALAPGIGAVLAIGGREIWRVRDAWLGRIILTVAVTEEC